MNYILHEILSIRLATPQCGMETVVFNFKSSLYHSVSYENNVSTNDDDGATHRINRGLLHPCYRVRWVTVFSVSCEESSKLVLLDQWTTMSTSDPLPIPSEISEYKSRFTFTLHTSLRRLCLLDSSFARSPRAADKGVCGDDSKSCSFARPKFRPTSWTRALIILVKLLHLIYKMIQLYKRRLRSREKWVQPSTAFATSGMSNWIERSKPTRITSYLENSRVINFSMSGRR